MKNILKCPKCHGTASVKEWDKLTKEMLGDSTPIAEGYGRMSFGYHCPKCFQFSSGKQIQLKNK